MRNLAVIAIVGSALLSGCGGGMVSDAEAAAAATNACAVQLGSFQLVATGFTADVVGTATYKYFPCANYALIFIPALAGTSNATSFTASPLPDVLIPATTAWQEAGIHGYDNGIENADMSVVIQSGNNVVSFFIKANQNGWTASGGKGLGLQVITVVLD